MSIKNPPKYFNESLLYHQQGQPGKIAITATKPLMTQEDLALAYSPGVAAPCLAIAESYEKIYDYTSKGNMVAVISNGTAVLGLGNIGAAASKPVMEGKAVLFKRFADIDGIDLEVNTEDPQEFINVVKFLGTSWGGINLEDIKAPECFIIEDELKKLLDIPVFHDDQHGTAIIVAAGLMNALDITKKTFDSIKIVVSGAGAAGIACIELLKALGVKDDNVILCDTKGVIYKGRVDGMNEWKEKHAANTSARTLIDAFKDADVFLGLSKKDAVSGEMVALMAPKPIIFAMANPDPEILPENVHKVRQDAIVATGRSDYPNQINNVMCFPYIFRGALDVRAKTINIEMKIAAAKAISELARKPVPQEVKNAYKGKNMQYGPDYIIPVPFDSRLITTVPVAVAKAAIETGVALKPFKNIETYIKALENRSNPTAYYMNNVFEIIKNNVQKIIIAEGEDMEAIKAAISLTDTGYVKPILVGRLNKITPILKHIGYTDEFNIEVINASIVSNLNELIEYLYKRLQRKGYLYRDCARLVKTNRHIFAGCLVALGYADGMVTGMSNNYNHCLDDILKTLPIKINHEIFSYSIFVAKDHHLLIADTNINENPTPQQIVSMCMELSDISRNMGYTPRVAMLSTSNFVEGQDILTQNINAAMAMLEERKVDFEYDGPISPEIALNIELLKLYPFSKLSGPANILIMPNLITAAISSQLLDQVSEGNIIGPVLSGISNGAQIVNIGSPSKDIVIGAAFAAIDAIKNKKHTK